VLGDDRNHLPHLSAIIGPPGYDASTAHESRVRVALRAPRALS